jgi:predicted branched-subunit amino acid permease
MRLRLGSQRFGGRSDVPVEIRRAILRDAAGIGLAVGAYGISFGAVSIAAGLSVAQTCALSTLAFTGASQFAFVGVVGTGGAPLAGTATALLLGSRNTLYALRMSALLDASGLRKLPAAHVTIDETTAMAVARTTAAESRLAFWATAASVFTLWNLATLVGALGAGALGDPRALGMDAAVPAAFLGLLWPRLRAGTEARAVALAGATVAVAASLTLPAGVPVLLAALVAVRLRGRR